MALSNADITLQIGFAVVSLIFVFGAAVSGATSSGLYLVLTQFRLPQGFIVGGLANFYLTDRFGFGKVSFIIDGTY